MAASPGMGTQEMTALDRELFGDDEPETQSLGPSSAPAAGAATSSAAAPSAAPLASQDSLLEQDLFGDFDSGNEAPPSAPPPAGGRLKRAQAEAAGAEAAQAPAPSRRPKKKRRTDLAKFADLEAEEADGDSGDEAEEDDLDDLIDAGAVPEVGARGQAELRRHMQQQSVELEEAKRQAAAAGPESGVRRVYGSGYLDRMQEKYEKMEQDAAAGLIPDAAAPRASEPLAPRNAFVVPDMEKDPKLWCNKTFAPEVELCISMMVKAVQTLEAGKQIPISTVFFSPHLRGYVYIEAANEVQIRGFTQGVRGFSVSGISLVPTNQMPQVFEASVLDAAKKRAVKVGDFVRIRRGLYQGDLGQIDEVKDQSYIVKLKPRLPSAPTMSKMAQGKQDRAAKQRPPPRWFNKMDVEADGTALVNVDRRMTPRGLEHFYTVEKEFYRDGFLYKEFKSSFFDAGEKVRPQQAELQDKRSAPPVNENTRPAADLRPKREEPKMLPPSTVPKKSYIERQQLAVGDQVIVTSGDVKNLRGVVTQALFQSKTVWVQPTVPPSSISMSLEVAILSKYFEIGDYVKVLAGEHEGDTGYVVKVVFNKQSVWDINTAAMVLSPTCSSEFKVRVDHLQLTCEDADPQDEKNEFQVGQLVRLDGQNDSRALIIRIEANSRVVVLATNNKTYIHTFDQIQPVSLPSQRTYQNNLWTLDRKQQKIKPGCVVKAPQAGIKGEPISAKVLYIHDNYVFLEATESLTGDQAFSCCQGGKCEYFWNMNEIKDAEMEAERLKKKALEDTELVEVGGMSYGIKMASETSWLKPHLKRKMGVDIKDNPGVLAKGAAVRIHGGSYKGLRAEVRESLGDKVRCSLLSINKLVIGPRAASGGRRDKCPRMLYAGSNKRICGCDAFDCIEAVRMIAAQWTIVPSVGLVSPSFSSLNATQCNLRWYVSSAAFNSDHSASVK
ncbi:unnamed protein product [Prorocentrum cordatum]|uniref:KOW domain-containing protein n=1 Tax=Prorocentrum cordatum TaxID=2364126 RepID=A0ABN9RXN8_9DINO|nr:unnamed protein product [Polarella glacialis]